MQKVDHPDSLCIWKPRSCSRAVFPLGVVLKRWRQGLLQPGCGQRQFCGTASEMAAALNSAVWFCTGEVG